MPQSTDPHPNTLRVAQCRSEIQLIFKTLRQLNETADLPSLSTEIGTVYYRLLDELTALELYLYLYLLSHREDGQNRNQWPEAH